MTGAFVDGCVSLTAIDAHARDSGVLIAKDATLSLSEYRGPAMLSLLEHEFEIAQLDNEALLEQIGNGTAKSIGSEDLARLGH